MYKICTPRRFSSSCHDRTHLNILLWVVDLGAKIISAVLGFAVNGITVWSIALHEMSHGFAACITGGSIVSIEVQWTNGLALTQGGWYPVISISGYLGTALFGALLFLASVHLWARWLTMFMLVATTVLLLYYSNWTIALGMAIAINAIVMVCLLWLHNAWSPSFFALLLLYPYWQDLQSLVWYQPEKTDAGLLAAHWGLPWLAWPIAIVYGLGTIIIWYFCIRHVLRSLNNHQTH